MAKIGAEISDTEFPRVTAEMGWKNSWNDLWFSIFNGKKFGALEIFIEFFFQLFQFYLQN